MTKNWQGLEQLGSDIKEIDNHIKEQATGVIKSGTVDNAKPVYFHPVFLVYSGSSKFIPAQDGTLYLTLTILNNSSEAFTKTSFLEWISKLEEQNYAYVTGTSVYGKTASGYIYSPVIEWSKTAEEWHILCYDTAGNSYSSSTATGKITWSNLESAFIRDGVNKIN